MELYGKEYLRNKLASKAPRVNYRYKFYEMKNYQRDLNIAIPKELKFWKASLGWCGTAVDSIADRLQFREFKDDYFEINEIFQMNNPDMLFDSAILSALISSCCFVYISTDETGYPRLEVIDGANATGVIDPTTGLLKEGYAVLKRDKNDNPEIEAYFTPDYTEFYHVPYKAEIDVIPNSAPYPLLVPIINRPDAKRVFGRSRISRACMSLTEAAIRTIKRSEISAEFYSFPQKWVTGLDPDAEELNTWKATITSMLRFSKDADGEKPTLGQFQQQSMAPHTDQLRMFASLFAGETGLTTDDLGFVSDNPSSSEAIKASHENLRLTARKAQKTFGSGFLNVGYLAACVRDDYEYERRQLYLSTPQWEPIFEPDAAALSGIGDGVIKINQSIPGFIGKEAMRNLTGIEGEANDEGYSTRSVGADTE